MSHVTPSLLSKGHQCSVHALCMLQGHTPISGKQGQVTEATQKDKLDFRTLQCKKAAKVICKHFFKEIHPYVLTAPHQPA